MRPTHTFAVVVVLLAIAAGCKRKDNREPPPPAEVPEAHPGFSPLPPLPAAPAKYPATHGGLVAWTLDAIGNELVKEKLDASSLEVHAMNSKAFTLLGKLLDDLPRTPKPAAGQPWVIRTPVDATADRELIDAEFARLWAALDQYRELFYRQRMRELVEGDRRVRAAGHNIGPAGQLSINPPPPARRVVTGGLDAQIGSRTWDWFDVDSTGIRAKWIMQHRTNMAGRVQFPESLEIDSPQAMAARLNGTVGRFKVRGDGPLAFDLAELTADEVEMHAAYDNAIVRVGPGVRKLKLWTNRGLILARGAGDIHIECPNRDDNDVVVILH